MEIKYSKQEIIDLVIKDLESKGIMSGKITVTHGYEYTPNLNIYIKINQ